MIGQSLFICFFFSDPNIDNVYFRRYFGVFYGIVLKEKYFEY